MVVAVAVFVKADIPLLTINCSSRVSVLHKVSGNTSIKPIIY